MRQAPTRVDALVWLRVRETLTKDVNVNGGFELESGLGGNQKRVMRDITDISVYSAR